MQFQRISPTKLLVLGPLEEVREATWYALWNSGNKTPIIDPVKNVVSGSQGDGFVTAARTATASFESAPEGTLVSFESKPVLGGSIDLGGGRRKAGQMLGALERLLQQGYVPPAVSEQAPPSAAAPIAAPTGAAPISTAARPIYGQVMAPKRGVTLLVYSILGVFFCGAIIEPLTLAYCIGALKDYGRRGDPGDKALVIAATVISSLLTLLIFAFIAFLIVGVSTGNQPLP